VRAFLFNPEMGREGIGEMPEPTAQPNNVTVADPTATTPTEPQTGATPESFEAWLEGQDEQVKTLYQSHSEKLLNTVKSTRDERDEFKKQLKDLSKKAEAGSELKQQLDAMSAQLEKAERRASFLEEAAKPEIQCRNPRAAWLLAIAEDLFDKKGLPDWAALKREAPELFGTPTANANAGRGTQNPPAKQNDMNAFIRGKTGRA
jgi:exonuclease VII large subunit